MKDLFVQSQRKFLFLKDQGNILRFAQWVLPVTLFLIATGFEIVEHLLKLFAIADESMPFNLTAEIILFGILGPTAVWYAIAYVRHLLNEETRARKDLAKLNQELESIVADRTLTLECKNEQLAKANIDLQALDRLKSDFVSLISHELRAPLTTLNGGLELAMQTADTLPPKAREILEIMTIESQRLTDLVQSILDVSLLESGKLNIITGPVSVRPLIEQATNIVLASNPRQVVWDIVKDLPPIWADETYLEQVIRNLIHNADKYSTKEHPIHICACQLGEQIRIGIKDHGPGIAPKDQMRIFDRFTRLQNDENAPSSWGLGLYFGKKLISAQLGSLNVTSPIWDDPRVPGSEFYILMPIAITPEDEL
jgi:signal transduction histidine kinase